MKNRSINIKTLTMVAVSSAISSVLMFVSISIPFFPSFLKIDVSEVPALITSFSLGPLFGVTVVFIKNLINLMFTTSGGIGEFANFIVGSIFVFVAGLIYSKFKTQKGAVLSMIFATICLSIFGSLTNYYILLPMYALITPMDSIVNMFKAINPQIDSVLKIVFFAIVPFNLIKGGLVSVITFLIYKRLSYFIKNLIR